MIMTMSSTMSLTVSLTMTHLSLSEFDNLLSLLLRPKCVQS